MYPSALVFKLLMRWQSLTNALKVKEGELSLLTTELLDLQSMRNQLEQDNAALIRTKKDVQGKLKMELDSALAEARGPKQKLELVAHCY